VPLPLPHARTMAFLAAKMEAAVSTNALVPEYQTGRRLSRFLPCRHVRENACLFTWNTYGWTIDL